MRTMIRLDHSQSMSLSLKSDTLALAFLSANAEPREQLCLQGTEMPAATRLVIKLRLEDWLLMPAHVDNILRSLST